MLENFENQCDGEVNYREIATKNYIKLQHVSVQQIREIVNLPSKTLKKVNIKHRYNKDYLSNVNMFFSILSKGDWINLREISLKNLIGPTACKMLSRGKWERLETVTLSQNQIGDSGITHLVKANWRELDITNKGLSMILKARWPQLQLIQLDNNQISREGTKKVFVSCWNNLKILSIKHNLHMYSESIVFANTLICRFTKINEFFTYQRNVRIDWQTSSDDSSYRSDID